MYILTLEPHAKAIAIMLIAIMLIARYSSSGRVDDDDEMMT